MGKAEAVKQEVQVQPQTTKALATEAPPRAPSRILASDVVIPRLLLMQGTSDLVKDRKAQLGDLVRSINAEKLGDPDKFLDFIPLAEPNPTWITEARAVGAQRWEFRGITPRTAANDTLPWKFNADKDGQPLPESTKSTHEWRRVKCLSLFAILPADITAEAEEMKKADAGEMPDLNKALAPVLITFRSTSFKAGKEVTTFFTQAHSFKQDAWKYMISLGCVLDKNDQGTFYVLKVDRSKPKPVLKEHLEKVAIWADIVKHSTNLKVDESGDEGEAGAVDERPATQSQF